MDVRQYYARIREVEATIPGPFAIVVSKATSEGGRAGVLTEVTPRVAAQLIVEDRARISTEGEARQFREAVLGQGKSTSKAPKA